MCGYQYFVISFDLRNLLFNSFHFLDDFLFDSLRRFRYLLLYGLRLLGNFLLRFFHLLRNCLPNLCSHLFLLQFVFEPSNPNRKR